MKLDRDINVSKINYTFDLLGGLCVCVCVCGGGGGGGINWICG